MNNLLKGHDMGDTNWESSRHKVLSFDKGVPREFTDTVAVEEPVEIRLLYPEKGEYTSVAVTTLMRTPGDDFELAAGFLYTEGIVDSYDLIADINYCVGESGPQEFNIVNVTITSMEDVHFHNVDRNFYVSSGCGVCGTKTIEALRGKYERIAPLELDAAYPAFGEELISAFPNKVREMQPLFDVTGGVHAAGLFDAQGTLVEVREDVGRHNAVDKVIGSQLRRYNLPLMDHILVVSSRASYDIVQKAISARIPVIVAVGAPSSLAIDLSQQYGLTLVGFARGNSFNVYSGHQRIRYT